MDKNNNDIFTIKIITTIKELVYTGGFTITDA